MMRLEKVEEKGDWRQRRKERGLEKVEERRERRWRRKVRRL